LDKAKGKSLCVELGLDAFNIASSVFLGDFLGALPDALGMLQACYEHREATRKLALGSPFLNKVNFEQQIEECYQRCNVILSQRAWWMSLMDDAREESPVAIGEMHGSRTGVTHISPRQRLLAMFWTQTTQDQRDRLEKLINAAIDLKARQFTGVRPPHDSLFAVSVPKTSETAKCVYSSSLSKHTEKTAIPVLETTPPGFPAVSLNIPLHEVNVDTVTISHDPIGPKVIISPQVLSEVLSSDALASIPLTNRFGMRLAANALTTRPVDNLLSIATRESDQDEKHKLIEEIIDEYVLMQIVMHLELTVESWHKIVKDIGETLNLVQYNPKNLTAGATVEKLLDLTTLLLRHDEEKFLRDRPNVDKCFERLRDYWNTAEMRLLMAPSLPLLLKSGSSDDRLSAVLETGLYILKFVDGAQDHLKSVINSLKK
jgi:hypothetical protein